MMDPVPSSLKSGYFRPIFSKCGRKYDMVFNPKGLNPTGLPQKSEYGSSYRRKRSSCSFISRKNDPTTTSKTKKDFFFRSKRKNFKFRTTGFINPEPGENETKMELDEIERMLYNSNFIYQKGEMGKDQDEKPQGVRSSPDRTPRKFRIKKFRSRSLNNRPKEPVNASRCSGHGLDKRNNDNGGTSWKIKSLPDNRKWRRRKASRKPKESRSDYLRRHGSLFEQEDHQRKRREIKMEVFLDYKLGLSASKFSNSLTFFKSKNSRVRNGLKKYRLRKLKNKARKLEEEF